MIQFSEEIVRERLRQSLAHPLKTEENIALWWLGQAGFVIRTANTVMMIDPYLSDFLSKKYKGKVFPHIRMMEPPLLPDEVEELDCVLCTHRHSDHMDPETLPILAHAHSGCTFVVPKADQAWAAQLVGDEKRLTPINAGQRLKLSEGILVEAIPAAHEELKVNDAGEHHFLGYILTIGDITLYHSGDCIPYPGLQDELKKRPIDLALLPINGRDDYRRTRNIPGNFTLPEAVELCQSVGIPFMICHHFGMFDFNTVNIEDAQRTLQQISEVRTYFLAKIGVKYILSP